MLLQWFWIPVGALGDSGDLPAVADLPDPPRGQEARRAVPDRDRERRRHDRLGGHKRTAAVQQSRRTRGFWDTRRRNWARLRPSSRSIPMTASGCSRRREKRARRASAKRLEYRIKHKDGSWRVMESVASTIRDAKGEVAKLVIVNRDITERKRAEQQLEHNLFHDPLTGLPNRRLFLDRLQSSFTRSRRDCGPALHPAAGEPGSFQSVQRKHGHGRRRPHPGGDWPPANRTFTAGRDHRAPRPCGGCRRTSCCSGWVEMNSPCCWMPWAIPAMRCGWPASIQTAVAEPFQVEGREVRVAMSIGIAMSTLIARARRRHIERCRRGHAPREGAGRIALRSFR